MLNTVFDTMKFEPYRQPKQTDSEITVGWACMANISRLGI